MTEDTLNDRAQQFRVIQKRLLVRFKDKNPAPMNKMDALLDDTYRTLMELSMTAKKCEDDLRITRGHLQHELDGR